MARVVTCFAVSFILAFSLSGCGDKKTTKKTTATTTTKMTTISPSTSSLSTPKPTPRPESTTMTTTNNIPGQTMSGDAAAKYLNNIYYGKGEKAETAVYITYQDTWYFPCGKGCYQGKPDCFMSYAAYNNKISLKTVGQEQHFKPYSNRQMGWILNSSALEESYGKCAYVFDGTTENRLYGGCGGPAKSIGKCQANSAYNNMCGKHKCTSTDQDVLSAYCKNIPEAQRPKKKADSPCYWKLPAFDNQSNELKDWYQERLEVQKNSETNLEEWNEIAVDLSVVKKDMMKNAAKVIVAFVYNDASGKEIIAKQRNIMQEKWQFKPGNDIPLIKIDWTKNVAANDDIFYFEGGESVLV